jgi:hypothetical protein
MNLLFAIDANTKEVIVSDSPKSSNKVVFIERIKQQENIIHLFFLCTFPFLPLLFYAHCFFP